LQNAIKGNETQVLNTIPIRPTIHFPRINLPFVEGLASVYTNQTLNPNPSYLTMTVLPPPTIPQQLNTFVKDWISPISGLWTFLAGIAVIVGPLQYAGIVKNITGKSVIGSRLRSNCLFCYLVGSYVGKAAVTAIR
jgi:hypothetical protein